LRYGNLSSAKMSQAPMETHLLAAEIPMSNFKLTLETMRLLLYVAWADDEIAPEEYDYLLRMGRNAGLGDEDVLSLDKALRDREALQRPDMEFLKPFRNEVLAHVRGMIRADNRIAPAETDILHKIASMLSE